MTENISFAFNPENFPGYESISVDSIGANDRHPRRGGSTWSEEQKPLDFYLGARPTSPQKAPPFPQKSNEAVNKEGRRRVLTKDAGKNTDAKLQVSTKEPIIFPEAVDHTEPQEDGFSDSNNEPFADEVSRKEEKDYWFGVDPNFYTFSAYFRRCLGAGHHGPPWFTFSYDVLFSCLFSIINMTILATLQYYGLTPYNLGMLSYLPSFGASSTLVFYLYTTPGAQPRALILTHICGAFLGISWAHVFKPVGEPLSQLLACAFAVGMMTAIMMVTSSFQPSASATTCLAAFHLYGQLNDQGYIFLVTPAIIGPVIIVFLGWIFNNLIPWRHCYPSWL